MDMVLCPGLVTNAGFDNVAQHGGRDSPYSHDPNPMAERIASDGVKP